MSEFDQLHWALDNPLDKMKTETITIHPQDPPIVELDSEARAAYVRFSFNEVAETELITAESSVVTMDRDTDGEVVGVEFAGVDEFTIAPLLSRTRLDVPRDLLERARYVSAGRALEARG